MPRTLDPSVNVTVPAGVPPPLGVTVAVKVTDWPNVDGFVDDTNEVVVGPLGVKFAVTDSGALMVTVVEALLALATLPS